MGPVQKKARLGQRRTPGPPPGTADEKDRESVFDKWADILATLEAAGAKLCSATDMREYPVDCAPLKATATLRVRSCSWYLYLAWCRAERVEPYPVGSDKVEDY